VVGPYVKHGAVISEKYTTVNMLRTIEDILNVDHLDILTASEKPMTKVFDLKQREWTFDAVPSAYLYNTQLPLPARLAKNKTIPKPTRDAAYWADKTKDLDFTREDSIRTSLIESCGKVCTAISRIRLSAADSICAVTVPGY
jgi:hypothetical protein